MSRTRSQWQQHLVDLFQSIGVYRLQGRRRRHRHPRRFDSPLEPRAIVEMLEVRRLFVGFGVSGSTPADGSTINTAPTLFSLDIDTAANEATIDATDLTVNGIAADSVTYTTGSKIISFTFNSTPVTAQGAQTMHVAAGAFTDVADNPTNEFSAGFVYDSIAPRVIATSVAPNAVLTTGSLTYQVTFSEAMLEGNLTDADFTLHGNSLNVDYPADTASFTPTVLTLDYSGLPADSYTLTLLAGPNNGDKFTDVAGNALDGEFSGTFPSGNGTAGGDFAIGFSVVSANQLLEDQTLTANLFLNLANTDDVGTFFDVVVRAYKNNDPDPIAEGTLNRLAAKRTDAVAKVITLTVDEDTTFAAGDKFTVKVFTRIDAGPGHNSGRLQLQYDAVSRSSTVVVNFGSGDQTLFLHGGGLMDTTDNTGDTLIDRLTVFATKSGGNLEVLLGSWEFTFS